MGKISKVFYEEIKPESCTVKEAAEFYYHFNLVASHESFHRGYEEYETNQINLKNKILGDVVASNKEKERPKVGSSILAISSLKQKVVLIADVC